MSPFNPELSPEEKAAHEETKRRQVILDDLAGEKALEELSGHLERELTPEEQERAFKMAEENKEKEGYL